MSLLTMRALLMSTGGDPSGADGLLAEIRAQRKVTDGRPVNGFDEIMEMLHFHSSMRFEQMLTTAGRVAEIRRAAGDLWGAADAECMLGYAIFCGCLLYRSPSPRDRQ